MGLLNKDLNTITDEIKSFKYFCARNSLGCGKLDVDSLQCKVNELQRDLRNYNSEKINKIKDALNSLNYRLAKHKMYSRDTDIKLDIIRDDILTIVNYTDSLDLD